MGEGLERYSLRMPRARLQQIQKESMASYQLFPDLSEPAARVSRRRQAQLSLALTRAYLHVRRRGHVTMSPPTAETR
jgi:hypothetical protein